MIAKKYNQLKRSFYKFQDELDVKVKNCKIPKYVSRQKFIFNSLYKPIGWKFGVARMIFYIQNNMAGVHVNKDGWIPI